MIKDLNIRPENIKLLNKNIEKKFLNIGHGINFLDVTKAQATKAQATKAQATKAQATKAK